MSSEQKTPVGGRRSDRIRQQPDRYTPAWSKGGKKATTLQEQEEVDSDDQDREVQPSTSPNKEGASFLSRMWPFGAKKSPVPSTLSSYARRRAQAKAELQKKIAILDKEVIDLQESMQITQCEIESFEEEVKRKTDICEPAHPLHNPEELVKLRQEIARSSYELADRKSKAKLAKIRATKRIEVIAIEKKNLAVEVDVILAEIDEQEEQHLGSDEELSDPEEEEMRKLRKEFQDWKSECGVSAPTIKDGYSHAKTQAGVSVADDYGPYV
ncbi:hypothetical protein Fcan01_18958 [Folsomia candida]|uniref:Uncharacterized protein n=1 Tax=Folsomia candida TaxID=158441 RepID=A0A226DM22_FOLCA|nr:hypothetical protein Fcan01_18958 [Folsomia candida]